MIHCRRRSCYFLPLFNVLTNVETFCQYQKTKCLMTAVENNQQLQRWQDRKGKNGTHSLIWNVFCWPASWCLPWDPPAQPSFLRSEQKAIQERRLVDTHLDSKSPTRTNLDGGQCPRHNGFGNTRNDTLSPQQLILLSISFYSPQSSFQPDPLPQNMTLQK